MFDDIEKANFWHSESISVGYCRGIYIEKLKQASNNQLVKVLLGQRRVGKSYIMRSFIKNLIVDQGVNAKNVFYVNKDLSTLSFIDNDDVFMKMLKKYLQKIKPIGKIYILIDEIQNIKNWEKIINSLSQDYTKIYEVYITGSNAQLLSSELATFIAGRYVPISVFPFSFNEYIDFLKLDKTKSTFIEYLKNGGMPELLKITNYETKINYINALKDSILLKDIIQRYDVRDSVNLENILKFLIDNIGGLFSINAIVKILNHNKHKISADTVMAYVNYFKNTYFIHEADRYDVKGKKMLIGEKKYYINDTGFKFLLNSGFDLNIGKLLENAVYLHYKREGYNVYTGKFAQFEIDFIAEKANNRDYIQVAYLLSDEDVIKREFDNLIKIKDGYKKMVITLDDISIGNRYGVEHKLAWEFIT